MSCHVLCVTLDDLLSQPNAKEIVVALRCLGNTEEETVYSCSA